MLGSMPLRTRLIAVLALVATTAAAAAAGASGGLHIVDAAGAVSLGPDARVSLSLGTSEGDLAITSDSIEVSGSLHLGGVDVLNELLLLKLQLRGCGCAQADPVGFDLAIDACFDTVKVGVSVAHDNAMDYTAALVRADSPLTPTAAQLRTYAYPAGSSRPESTQVWSAASPGSSFSFTGLTDGTEYKIFALSRLLADGVYVYSPVRTFSFSTPAIQAPASIPCDNPNAFTFSFTGKGGVPQSGTFLASAHTNAIEAVTFDRVGSHSPFSCQGPWKILSSSFQNLTGAPTNNGTGGEAFSLLAQCVQSDQCDDNDRFLEFFPDSSWISGSPTHAIVVSDGTDRDRIEYGASGLVFQQCEPESSAPAFDFAITFESTCYTSTTARYNLALDDPAARLTVAVWVFKADEHEPMLGAEAITNEVSVGSPVIKRKSAGVTSGSGAILNTLEPGTEYALWTAASDGTEDPYRLSRVHRTLFSTRAAADFDFDSLDALRTFAPVCSSDANTRTVVFNYTGAYGESQRGHFTVTTDPASGNATVTSLWAHAYVSPTQRNGYTCVSGWEISSETPNAFVDVDGAPCNDGTGCGRFAFTATCAVADDCREGALREFAFFPKTDGEPGSPTVGLRRRDFFSLDFAPSEIDFALLEC